MVLLAGSAGPAKTILFSAKWLLRLWNRMVQIDMHNGCISKRHTLQNVRIYAVEPFQAP